MPAPSVLDGQIMTNVAPGMGGIERDPLTLYAHTNPGAASEVVIAEYGGTDPLGRAARRGA